MPTLMLKLLALTGVISAGCFAVWKANTELQPVEPKNPSEFTAVEGESAPSIGLGGQAVSNAGDSAAHAETEPAIEPAPADEPLQDKTLALASRPFPTANPAPQASPVEPVPAESSEPAPTEPEPIEPIAGVTSLEHLEATEKNKSAAPATSAGASAAKTPAVNAKALSAAGTPALIAIPKSAAASESKPRLTAQVVPVSAEEPTETAPELLPEASSEPSAPGVFPAPDATPEIIPASEEAPASQPGLNVPPLRTRSAPSQPADAVPTPAEEPSPFEQEVGGTEGQTEPAEPSPIAVPDKTRSSIPHAIETEPTVEPAIVEPTNEPSPLTPETQPQALPEPLPASHDGEAPAEHHPKSSLPRKPAEDLLYGESTSEVPQLAPSQQPQLRIEKKAQAEAEIGEKFIYEIFVENIGQVTADKVVVEERIPNNCKMERSAPTATLSPDHLLRWELGEMPPHTNKTIKVEVTPLKAGPVGSVATVRFASMVSTKTMVTAPTLSMSVDYPREAAVGEPVPVKFTLKNTGSGTARKVMLRTVLPEGLSHPHGPDVSLEDLTLKPNESKELTLVVTPEKAGQYTPSTMVMANGVDQQDQTLKLNVIPAYLTLTRQAHAQRFVKRPAVSVTKVANNSSKAMKNIRVSERLPEGLEPVVAELGNADWNPTTRTVSWTIPALGPRQEEEIKLTVISVREGDFASKMAAVDAADHRAELDSTLEVRGFPALSLDFQGDGNAVAAIGEQVSMKVTVRNRGSATAKGVQAVFEVPPQMTFVTAKGPSKFTQEGNHITFAELDELNPDDAQTYDIVLVAAEEGRPKVAVELMSQDRPEPVRQEEPVTITPP